MSYILDALRKADAERERDPARGIHAQPLAGMPAPATRSRALALAGGAAAGFALVGVLVYASRPAPTPPVVVAAVDMPAVRNVASTAPEPAPAPAANPVANAVLPPAPAPLPAPPRAVVKAPAPAAVAATTVPAGPVPAATAAPAAAGAVLKAPPTEVAERVLALSELPPEVRNALPKLAISGGVHSANAAQRMLIVGGEVQREGTEVAPGVMLEQIRARAAVLRFRDYRFSIVY